MPDMDPVCCAITCSKAKAQFTLNKERKTRQRSNRNEKAALGTL